MKIKLLLIVIGITLLSSCNKFLDVQPQVVLTPIQSYQTTTQITAAIAGIYTNFKYIYASAYETEYTVATDESYYYNTSFPFTNYSNTSTDNSTNNTAGFWKYCYQSIDNANLLLDNIDASGAIGHVDTAIVRRAKGETYFLRGYYYFLLAQWFGSVPLELHSLSSPTQVNVARTPLLQVYNQIIADMTTADSLLYDQTFATMGYSERVTQEAVEGILARVCLYAAGQPNNDTKRYNDALHWATKLINANTHSLVSSYPQIFIDECEKNYNLENIWEIGFNEKGPGKLSSGGGVGVFCGVSNTVASSTSAATGNVYDSGYCYAYVKLHPRLYCSFESGDYRRNWNVANYYFSSLQKLPFANNIYWSRNPAKWRREYEPEISRSVQATSGTNFPMLRYADVLLMAAEAENEVNGPANAYQYINPVRERSISKTLIIDSITVTEGTGYTSPQNQSNVQWSNLTGINAVINLSNLAVVNKNTGVTTFDVYPFLVSQGSGFTSTPTVTIGNQWAAGTTYDSGMQVAANGRLYTVTVTGTSTSTAPTNTSGSSKASSTGAVFTYAGAAAKVIVHLSQTPTQDLPSGLSQNQFRAAIQMERYHELAFEALRLGDLRRWGILITTIQSLAADINGANSTYPQIPPILNELGAGSDAAPLAPIDNINGKDLYWPIPQYELSLDPLLTQNPGY
jgi:hypothetical protein